MRGFIDGFDPNVRAIVALVAVGVVIVGAVTMNYVARIPTSQGVGPQRLEFAALRMTTRETLRHWDKAARGRVIVWHLIDSLWAAAYATLLTVAAASLALTFGEEHYQWMGDLGGIAAALAAGAFVADVIENVLSIAVVRRYGSTGETWWLLSILTAMAAIVKFALVAAAVGYVLVAAALAAPAS